MKKKEEKKSNKKNILIIASIVIILALIAVIVYLLFFKNNDIKITYDLGDGVKQTITIKEGEKVTLPEEPKKEGKVFAGWRKKKTKEYIINSEDITEDLDIEASWIDETKTIYTMTFMDGDKVLGIIKIADGETITLPIVPTKEGFIFYGWLNEDGNLINAHTIITKDSIFYALWFEEGKEHVNISFDPDNGEDRVIEYSIEKGSEIKFPVNPSKTNKSFGGWKVKNGDKVISKGAIADKSYSLIAIWNEPYNCPDECTPIEDGSKCTKTTTTEKVSKTQCPSGAFLYYGKCITLRGAGDATVRQCDGDMTGKEVYYKNYCAKVVKKETVTECPKGYTENEDGSCIKSETLTCTKI